MALTALDCRIQHQPCHLDIIDTTALTCLDSAMMWAGFVKSSQCLGSFLQKIFRRIKVLVATLVGHQSRFIVQVIYHLYAHTGLQLYCRPASPSRIHVYRINEYIGHYRAAQSMGTHH